QPVKTRRALSAAAYSRHPPLPARGSKTTAPRPDNRVGRSTRRACCPAGRSWPGPFPPPQPAIPFAGSRSTKASRRPQEFPPLHTAAHGQSHRGSSQPPPCSVHRLPISISGKPSFVLLPPGSRRFFEYLANLHRLEIALPALRACASVQI